MAWEGAVVAEGVVEHETDAHFGAKPGRLADEGDPEFEGFDEMRGDAEEDFAFAEVHADEGEIEHFEIAEAAMDEAGGA